MVVIPQSALYNFPMARSKDRDTFKKQVVRYFDEHDEAHLAAIIYDLDKQIADEKEKGNSVVKLAKQREKYILKQKDFYNGRIPPISLPGLALYLSWTVDEIVTYPVDGPYSKILEYAKTRLEAFLIDSIYLKRIDRATGAMMLEKYFGGKRGGDAKSSGRPKKSIAQIIKDIEQKNAEFDRRRAEAVQGV